MTRLSLYLVLIISLVTGCFGKKEQPRDVQARETKEKEPIEDLYRSMVGEESDRIDAYVKRRGWDMESTGTGLRYMIYEKADTTQPKAQEGQVAVVTFEIKLLDGTLCYTSEEKGPQPFMVGRDNVESGLHEGITYMRVGDKAKLILPSHLAHGLVGDQQKIPPSSTIIYDLELIDLR